MNNCGHATTGLTLGNRMDIKYGTDNFPHIENEDVVIATMDATDPEVDDTGRVMETPL